MILRQSTSQAVLVGPFVDSTDGVSPEAGLTIANTDVKLSKDGAAFGNKNSGGATADGSNGWYTMTLDATDTATVGILEVEITVSGALPVFKVYYVVEEAVYDALYAASAAGPLQSTTAGRTLDVTATGAAGVDWGNVENPTTAVDLSATDIQLADTVTTLTNLPAITSNWLTAAGIAASALDGKGDWSTHAATDIVSAGAITTLTGAVVNVDLVDVTTTNTDLVTAAAIADAVWLETLADHSGSSGSTAEALNAAGAAGDPWTTALPGAYGAGSAGNILGNNLPDVISLNNIEARVDASMVTYGLDHLISTSVTGTDVTDNSIIAQIVSKSATADWDSFNNTTDSMEGSHDAIVSDTTSIESTLNLFVGTTQPAQEAKIDGIKAVTDVIPDSGAMTSIATAAALATVDGNVDAILVDTGTTIPASIAALNDISAADVLTTQMTESYAADGVAPTLAQSSFLVQQALTEFAIAGTTITIKQLDGSTTAATLTLDDGTSPTSATRAT